MTDEKINAGTRFSAMVLDHFIMTFGAMIFAVPGMISGFANAFKISHEQTTPNLFGDMLYLNLVGFAVYFCKDSINGRSPAKRIMKLQVVDNSTGRAASPIKCFIRNIFCVLWPVEVIVALFNPERRIGDFVAGTKVVVFDPATEQPKTNWAQAGISLALAYGLMLIVLIPFNRLQAGLQSGKVKYVESSFNEQESRATERLFTDSLGSVLTPDIRVYDKLENENLKYVSVILRLKENLLDDEETFGQLKSSTMPLLFSKFPERTFVGQVRYVYQSGGNMQSRSFPIDWRQETSNE